MQKHLQYLKSLKEYSYEAYYDNEIILRSDKKKNNSHLDLSEENVKRASSCKVCINNELYPFIYIE